MMFQSDSKYFMVKKLDSNGNAVGCCCIELNDNMISPIDVESIIESLPFTDCGSYTSPTQFHFIVEKASNLIARKTMRGRGNHLYFREDYVVVFYKGVNPTDTPIIENDDGIYLHPDYPHYFVKLKRDNSIVDFAELIRLISLTGRYKIV